MRMPAAPCGAASILPRASRIIAPVRPVPKGPDHLDDEKRFDGEKNGQPQPERERLAFWERHHGPSPANTSAEGERPTKSMARVKPFRRPDPATMQREDPSLRSRRCNIRAKDREASG